MIKIPETADKELLKSSNKSSGFKLWNINFFLLWQGQLISLIGTTLTRVALGFLVLSLTGSTALMSMIMAFSIIPVIVFSPFAGVIVDRSDRKIILITADIIRGIIQIFTAIALIGNFFMLWMLFVAAIILGLCDSFFDPAVNSSIPDIVPKAKIINANSALSAAFWATDIVGNSLAGLLYQLIGAPLMFLYDGFSYIVSSCAVMFMKIPKIQAIMEKKNSYFEDLKFGFSYVWNSKGVKYLFLTIALMRFCSFMSMMLILPLFQKTHHLGTIYYGLIMSIFALGAFSGQLVLTAINIRSNMRHIVLCLFGMVSSIAMIVFSLILHFPVMAVTALIFGFSNSIIGTIVFGGLQATTASAIRGKLFSLLSAFTLSLTPIAMIAGGILAEYISISFLISTSFILRLFMFALLFYILPVKQLINYDSTNNGMLPV